MKDLNFLISIIDELYTRTHIPCVILDESHSFIYPKISIMELMSFIDHSLMDFSNGKIMKMIIEDDAIAYMCFSFSINNKQYYMLSGCLLNNLTLDKRISIPKRWTNIIPEELIKCHISSEYLTAFQSFSKMIYSIITHEIIQDDQINIIHMSSEKTLSYEDDTLTLRRILQTTPSYYQWEQNFFKSFDSGNMNELNSLLSQLHIYDIDDSLMNTLEDLKYKYVSFITLLTRNIIKNGVSFELAFSMSDQYLKKLQDIQSESQLTLLLRETISEFFTLASSSRNSFSLNVTKSIHFIDTHLYDKLSLQTLADYTGLRASYLSVLFKQEVGENITHYIQKKKIEEAQRLLLFTDKTYSEISSLLNFNSQSNFIQIFKKMTGTTPKKYQTSQRKDL